MKTHCFGKFSRTLGAWITVLCMSLLLSVSACAQTKSPLLRCKECLSKNDFAGALDAGRAATEADPQNAEAWLLLGRAQFETGAFDEAEITLTKIDPLTDDHRILEAVNDLMGNIYLANQGQLEKAQDCFQKEMAHAREIPDHPGEALAHYNIGKVLRKRDFHNDARKEFEEALNLDVRDAQRIVYQSALAEELLLTGNTAAAIGTMQVVDHTAKKVNDVKVKAKALFAYGQLYTLAGEAARKTGVPTNGTQALEYFRLADAKLQAGFKALRDANVHDLYSEALGYQLFGKLVEIQGNIKAAIARYKQGLDRAEQMGSHVELVYDLRERIGNLSLLAKNEYIFGAIDIGSKGVKGVLVSIASDGRGNTSIQELYRRNINTDLNASREGNNGNFSTEAMKKTSIAVRDLIREMRNVRQKESKITDILVAGSSSLAQGRNRPELARQIFLMTKDEAFAPANRLRATPETATPFVKSGEELFYGILGSTKPEDRQSASLVDIGSGNGRWGYIYIDSSGRTPVALDIRLGSVSLAAEAEKNRLAGEDYITALEREADRQIGARMRRQMQENSVIAKHRKVYLIGGAVYAMVTLLHPEAAKQDEVELTHEDLRRFYDLVKSGSKDNPYTPETSQIADADTRELANEQIDNVLHEVFKTREQLLSAAILLRTLEINALKSNQKLVFPRHGGWALGLAQYKYFVGAAE